jgi:branched-chain amino acid transport system permease protein
LDGVLIAQSLLNGFTSAGIYMLVAVGLTLVLSIMNIVQLSHGEIYMIGAYLVYFMVVGTGLNFYLAIVISTLFVGCFGILLERVCFRPMRGTMDRALIVSIALMIIFQTVMLSIAGGNPKSYSSPFKGVIEISGVAISWERMSIVIVAVVLISALFIFIRFTKTGQAMLALSQEREGAALQGVSIDRLSAIAMFLGCGLAAIAGALVGALFSISPDMGGWALMKGIIIIVLGGLGSVPGAVLGGLIIGLIDGIMPVITTPHIAGLIGFGAVILILIFRPQGLWGHE